MKPHRIAAGGIIFNDDSILLVRYGTGDGSSYLVGPGGALESGENAVQAIVRETMEETMVVVHPHKILLIEDLLCLRFKMCKIWMLCDVISGDVKSTAEAKAEGIAEARWFKRTELDGEVVFPPPVMLHEWDEFRSDTWEPQCLATRVANF